MHIGFIEDTPLRGGTQIWVCEAVKNFVQAGEDVSVIAPEGLLSLRFVPKTGQKLQLMILMISSSIQINTKKSGLPVYRLVM